MSASRLNRRMSAEDAWFLYFEKPDAPLHIGSVGIYEGTIPFEKMYASMDARMHLIPRYRQRAVTPPLFAGHPTWEDDAQFSLDRHLRLMELPAPGTMDQLRALSAEIFAEMLPRDRPLWDITVIHGVEGDRTAYVSRVHHCLVDGVSGIELLLAVLDLVPNPEPTPQPETPWSPQLPPTPIESWADAVFDQWSTSLRAMSEWQQEALDVRGQVRRAQEFAHALEVALPAALQQPPKMPWNKPIGGKRVTAWTEMSFQEVRGIRSALGGTVNDVMLTILGGAFGRYLRECGVSTASQTLRLMIPVNVRAENEKGALGNRVSMMLPNLPIDDMPPADRLVAVRAEMERLKSQSQANAFEALRAMSENLPAMFHALAGMNGVPPGGANLVCTNVPGPMIPLWSVGHRMLAHYPLVPLAGDMGIGVGITSFNTALYLGIIADPAIVGDVDLITRYADDEFRALRDAAGVPVSDLPDIGAPARHAPTTNGHKANGVAAAAATQPPPVPAT
jgi:WS/DGAT/MGAT family acyltransferase